MKFKRLSAALLAGAMMLPLAGCGGSKPAAGGSGAAAGGDVNITIYNSKSEIQEQMEEMAERYSDATGVGVEVYYSSDTVAAHLATRYASNDPYTISMVDPKDIPTLAEEHAVDLSDQDWVANTDYASKVGDTVYGFPVCVEARGIIYNADAIEAIIGKTFDPAEYATLDAFKALIDELKAGGMETPCGVQKEDWSLAGHFLCDSYEMHDDVNAFIDALYAGEADLENDAIFNSMIDTFDVLKENNYAAASPIAAEREVTEQKLAEGEIAFLFGGNWDWSVINAYDYTENMGMMPIPQNTDSDINVKLVGGDSKVLFIDSSENTTDAQRDAAKDFLNWLVFDAEGQAFLTEDCALVPAFSNIQADNLDPLGASVKKYADAGALIPTFNYLPDDHYSVVGAIMQKYLAGEIDRAGLAKEVQGYWSSTTPVEHN